VGSVGQHQVKWQYRGFGYGPGQHRVAFCHSFAFAELSPLAWFLSPPHAWGCPRICAWLFPFPACFRAPQKGALDFRAPRPQADAGVARGWVALACAGKAQVRASEGCSSQASEDLGRRCLASMLLVVLVPHSSLGGGSARLSARVPHLSAARDGARRGSGEGWGGRGTAD
jgi:hypothetical protein